MYFVESIFIYVLYVSVVYLPNYSSQQQIKIMADYRLQRLALEAPPMGKRNFWLNRLLFRLLE